MEIQRYTTGATTDFQCPDWVFWKFFCEMTELDAFPQFKERTTLSDIPLRVKQFFIRSHLVKDLMFSMMFSHVRKVQIIVHKTREKTQSQNEPVLESIRQDVSY